VICKFATWVLLEVMRIRKILRQNMLLLVGIEHPKLSWMHQNIKKLLIYGLSDVY